MRAAIDQKIVIVTRQTQLGALRRKFATRSMARFQIMGARRRELMRVGAPLKVVEQAAEAAFAEVDAAAQTYDETLRHVRQQLDAADLDIPVQTIDREFVPNFLFGPNDVIVTIGQDGLVANTAKYVLGRPIVAVNPDPQRIDGVLLPFGAKDACDAVRKVLAGRARFREVTLAQATLADGQKLLAFNELFIGCRSHISARYRIGIGDRSENQSSSGVLVATGAGSTGWLSSIFNMTSGIASVFSSKSGKLQKPAIAPPKLTWENHELVYVVREPFASRTSKIQIVAGVIRPDSQLTIESEMASEGVIFSDGVESDFLEFNSGVIAHIGAAPGRAKIVIP